MYAPNKTIIKFALSPEEMELLNRNMEFYHCSSRGKYFKLKLMTDNVLFEDLKRSKENGSNKSSR